ncbi:hypothetical protein [Aestuariivirga sp.]|uniref:hypothetical protein n=1 Tax=Aestuariivirga sp. TaxID=2650926 RepID=UPI00359348B6
MSVITVTPRHHVAPFIVLGLLPAAGVIDGVVDELGGAHIAIGGAGCHNAHYRAIERKFDLNPVVPDFL